MENPRRSAGKRATLGVLQNPELIKEMNLDGKTYQEVKMWRTPDAVSGRGADLGQGSRKALEPGTSETTEWSTDSSSGITGSSEGETIMANANSGRSHEPNNKIQTGRNIPIL